MIRHVCKDCPRPKQDDVVAQDGIQCWKLDEPGGCDNCGAFGDLWAYQPADPECRYCQSPLSDHSREPPHELDSPTGYPICAAFVARSDLFDCSECGAQNVGEMHPDRCGICGGMRPGSKLHQLTYDDGGREEGESDD